MKALLKGVNRGWTVFAHGLGRVQTFLVLSVFYLVVIGVISLVYRACVGNPLQQKGVGGSSDWVRKPRTNLSLGEARQIF